MTFSFAGTVRALRAEDLASIERILGLWIRDSPSQPPLSGEIEQYLALMAGSLVEDRGFQYLVAVMPDDLVVGVVGLRPTSREMQEFALTNRSVEMINAYVETRLRKGHGVGTALVRQVEQLARERGYSEIVLNSGPRYERTGWEFFDRLEGYERRGLARNLYGEGGHAPVWSKIL